MARLAVRFWDAGVCHNEGHMIGFSVRARPFADEAVSTCKLAVVAGDNNNGIVRHSKAIQLCQNPLQHLAQANDSMSTPKLTEYWQYMWAAYFIGVLDAVEVEVRKFAVSPRVFWWDFSSQRFHAGHILFVCRRSTAPFQWFLQRGWQFHAPFLHSHNG